MEFTRPTGYQICSKTVMDTDGDPFICFDQYGVCNYVYEMEKKLETVKWSKEEEKHNLETIAAEIKKRGKGKPYDCVIGVSGGVDSTFLALTAVHMGLRPLLVHFDNGWNSELAVENIKRTANTLNLELYTYVINWPEFRDLQRSFLLAGVVDVELVTDHAIVAAMYGIAKKRNIPTVLSGTNVATEGFMPPDWSWDKMDKKHIFAIHKKFGRVPLETFPSMSHWYWLLISKLKLGGITYVRLLDQMQYSQKRAINAITAEIGWRSYPAKHHESIITRFYQCYILPKKFGFDKRRLHLSNLILNGELTREEAIRVLQTPACDPDEITRDLVYVCKKLQFSEEEFEYIMNSAPISHEAYPNSRMAKAMVKKIVQSAIRLLHFET